MNSVLFLFGIVLLVSCRIRVSRLNILRLLSVVAGLIGLMLLWLNRCGRRDRLMWLMLLLLLFLLFVSMRRNMIMLVVNLWRRVRSLGVMRFLRILNGSC